jgi:hypothetical protein
MKFRPQDAGTLALIGAPLPSMVSGADPGWMSSGWDPPWMASGSGCLPSGNAALALVRGDLGAGKEVAKSLALRGALAALGLAAVGFRGAQILSGTIGVVLAIEGGVLVWAWLQEKK